jgi:hypothetical protein
LTTFFSTLALLMARVSADHTHDAFPAHDLAIAAEPLYRSLNSHLVAPVS